MSQPCVHLLAFKQTGHSSPPASGIPLQSSRHGSGLRSNATTTTTTTAAAAAPPPPPPAPLSGEAGLESFRVLQQFLQTWKRTSTVTPFSPSSPPSPPSLPSSSSSSSSSSALPLPLVKGTPATTTTAATTGTAPLTHNAKAKLPTPVCNECKTHTPRLHACLECTHFGCWKQGHALSHMAKAMHLLACDVQKNQIYCFACKDYVYDLDLERIVREEAQLVEERLLAAKNRIPFCDWVPSNSEAQVLNLFSRPQPLSDESTLGLRGLNNLGNTCFMNCILQALIHNPLLRNYFLADQHTVSTCFVKSGADGSSEASMMQIDGRGGSHLSNGSHHTYTHGYSNGSYGHGSDANGGSDPHGDPSNSLCMACEMDKLLRQFFSGETVPHTPYQFLHSVWKHAKHLAGYEQQDAHEFFIATLNAMHTHCRGTATDCQCIIHRIFTGALQSDVTCLKCSTVSSTVDPFWDISLNLPHHKSSGGENEASSNSLIGCLNRFIRPEKLGEKFFCSRCNHYQECIKQFTIKSLPIVVCFHLKRFEHSVKSLKIDTFIEFPAHLDMSSFLSSTILRGKNGAASEAYLRDDVSMVISNLSSVVSGESTYSLFAVVNHHGSIDTGHYTCFVRQNAKWFKCDDAWITLVSLEQVLESEGYLLFYIKDELEYTT